MRSIMHIALLLLFAGNSFAQNEKAIKVYPAATKAGAVTLLSSRFSSDGNVAAKIFTIQSPVTVACELKAITALLQHATLDVLLDNRSTGIVIKATENGWQKITAGNNGVVQQLVIPAGKHELSFTAKGNVVPMVDDIYLQSAPGKTDFDTRWEQVKQMIDKASALPYQPAETDKTQDNTSNIVLANPEGVYNHEVDVSFAYTTFSTMYLTAGTTITFATSGSTVDPAIMLFDPAAIDSRSWSNDDDGPGYESILTVTIPVSAYYNFVARPYHNAVSGTCNITKNGVSWLTNTPLGGTVLGSAVRTGELNYFTCRHTADTRIFTESFNSGPFNGYNDDYVPVGGAWSWGTASRIKKNFISNVTTTFVCAYSLSGTGVCDVYMGNPNSDATWAFPLLTTDDAIKTAESTGQYNCTSWAGGVTSTWIWPPEWSSQYCCNPDNTKLDCFDNFYGNFPMSRFPGAWTYTRTGATLENSVVDLWKRPDGVYTHASVRKPGNGNPHGYDWESKPGGLTRTLHPRNALNGNGYGAVGNYYKPTGTYGSLVAGGKGYDSDADAIKAGVAVIENAKLTKAANDKLDRFISTVNKNTLDQFNALYEAWKNTWAASSMFSDPEEYCKNTAFDALSAFCNSNYKTIYLVFDKYLNGDIFIGKILWENTRKQYSKLLDEAKAEYLQNPMDEQGRFKIHGDHDNGVHYVEKILKAMSEEPVVVTAADNIKFSVSPNPVRDIITVKVVVTEKQNISVQLISLLSNKQVWIQTLKEFEPGEYKFTANVSTPGFTNGDMIAVKLTAGATQKTIKAIVVK